MYKWTTLSCPWNTNLRPSRFISFCIGTFSTLGGLYCYTHAFRNVFTMQHWNARHNFEYKCKYNKQVKCILLGGGLSVLWAVIDFVYSLLWLQLRCGWSHALSYPVMIGWRIATSFCTKKCKRPIYLSYWHDQLRQCLM